MTREDPQRAMGPSREEVAIPVMFGDGKDDPSKPYCERQRDILRDVVREGRVFVHLLYENRLEGDKLLVMIERREAQARALFDETKEK